MPHPTKVNTEKIVLTGSRATDTIKELNNSGAAHGTTTRAVASTLVLEYYSSRKLLE